MESLGQQMHGEVESDYQPTGIIYKLDAPLSGLTVKA